MDAKTMMDARPALPISDKSLWDQAERTCDDISSIINEEFKAQNITAWVRRSQPGEYPVYVVVDSWIQREESPLAVTFDKSFLKVTISVDPYREYPLLYKVELNRYGRSLSNERWVLSHSEVRELARYQIQGGEKPSFMRPEVSAIEGIIGAFIPFIGKPPENKLILDARPNYRTLPVALTASGLIAAFGLWIAFSDQYEDNTALSVLCLLVAAGFVFVAAYISHRRPVAEAIPKQPIRTPRREFRIDSWHVSVPCAGTQFESFRDRLYTAVSTKDPDILINRELHQNQTPRGFEERERLVLCKGQATLHIHIYPFLNDAFVGWESYLNWNRWEQSAVVSSTVRNGRTVQYRSLSVGVHVPTDFDLIEADVLSETTHRLIVEEIKAFLREKEIEADLDFKIIRGDRSNALKEGKSDK